MEIHQNVGAEFEFLFELLVLQASRVTRIEDVLETKPVLQMWKRQPGRDTQAHEKDPGDPLAAERAEDHLREHTQGANG